MSENLNLNTDFRRSMPKSLWLTFAFLAVIIVGSLSQMPKYVLEISDKTSLVEITLDDLVEMWGNDSLSESGLILLYTPNLSGLQIPSSVRGVPIHVLTQSQIDELSMSHPVDYIYYERIQELILRSGALRISSGPQAWRSVNPFNAEVEMTFEWQYQVGVNRYGLFTSGSTFYCTKQKGQWIIDHGFIWIP